MNSRGGMNVLAVLGIVGLLVALFLIGYFRFVKIDQKESAAPSPSAQVVASTSGSPAGSIQTISNPTLGLSYQVPAGVTVNNCQDFPCANIDQYTFRLEPLESTQFNVANPQLSLQQDFYCAASGPGTNINCTNNKIEPFTNAQGTKGYKIFRTRTVEGGANNGTYEDVAYIFPINKGVSNDKYVAVLLAIDQDNPANQTFLDNLANSVVVK